MKKNKKKNDTDGFLAGLLCSVLIFVVGLFIKFVVIDENKFNSGECYYYEGTPSIIVNAYGGLNSYELMLYSGEKKTVSRVYLNDATEDKLCRDYNQFKLLQLLNQILDRIPEDTKK